MSLFSKKEIASKFKVGDLYRYSSIVDNSVGVIKEIKPNGYLVEEFTSVKNGGLYKRIIEYRWDSYMSVIDQKEYDAYVKYSIDWFEQQYIPEKEKSLSEIKDRLSKVKEAFSHIL